MVSKGEGSIQKFEGRTWIYIPKSIAEDSAFPFIKGEKVRIEVNEGRIIISQLKINSTNI